ncbi:hypothetical protein HDU85_001857 [Gaertneriomyces sp. JEL0708]|nr:hypothetical protein HDU85_001857 [Gaertneriomyces sp. JEL0708]
MGVLLLTSIVSHNASLVDERWKLIKVYQAVAVFWALWIFNSVFGKTVQKWISAGLNPQKFGDAVLIGLTVASVLHITERVVTAYYVVPWHLPIQLFFDKFMLIWVFMVYAAISTNLYLASDVGKGRHNSSNISGLFVAVSCTSTLPVFIVVIAQCIVAGLSHRFRWELDIAVCATVVLAFGVQCTVLNLARRNTVRLLGQARPSLSPLLQQKEHKMIKKMGLLIFFTIFGVLNTAAYAVRIWVLGPARVGLNDRVSANVTRHDTILLITMGFIEMIFFGAAAAGAVDLFEVSSFTATSPFMKHVEATESALGVPKHGAQQTAVMAKSFSRPLDGAPSMSPVSRGAAGDLAAGTDAKGGIASSTADRENQQIKDNEELLQSMIQLADEQALWWKRMHTITLQEFMEWPNPFSSADVRIWMFIIFGLTCGAIALDVYAGSSALYWYLAVTFTGRWLFGVRIAKNSDFQNLARVKNTNCRASKFRCKLLVKLKDERDLDDQINTPTHVVYCRPLRRYLSMSILLHTHPPVKP